MAKLYFRYGAMNSGKTTALIQVAIDGKDNVEYEAMCARCYYRHLEKETGQKGETRHDP